MFKIIFSLKLRLFKAYPVAHAPLAGRGLTLEALSTTIVVYNLLSSLIKSLLLERNECLNINNIMFGLKLKKNHE